jgi:mannonate dehydratase
MRQTWRWFGPKDPISLSKIRQAGATGVVTALHHVRAGEVWTEQAIAERQALLERAGLEWSVVESLPVPSPVRLQEPGYEQYIERYITSLDNLGKRGVKTICYNFMPVIDWTRTDLDWRGASTTRPGWHSTCSCSSARAPRRTTRSPSSLPGRSTSSR